LLWRCGRKNSEEAKSRLFACCDRPISTGRLKRINHKSKALQKQAYEFRNTDFFKGKIMAVHQAESALLG